MSHVLQEHFPPIMGPWTGQPVLHVLRGLSRQILDPPHVSHALLGCTRIRQGGPRVPAVQLALSRDTRGQQRVSSAVRAHTPTRQRPTSVGHALPVQRKPYPGKHHASHAMSSSSAVQATPCAHHAGLLLGMRLVCQSARIWASCRLKLIPSGCQSGENSGTSVWPWTSQG